MATPALDKDLGFLERGEDLAVEQLVPELTLVTPIERIASATGRPCAVSTSTCRSLATISSGLCLFLDIDPSSSWLRAIPQGGPLLRGQTNIADRFTDLNERVIDVLANIYPWEWLFVEEFGPKIPRSGTRFIEPAWKAMLSTKAILPLLWERHPGHPNLLPSYFEGDSTGLELFGKCEWNCEKHGRARRSWRKLHLAVDAGMGEIVASVLTSKDAADAGQVPVLLEQVEGEIASVMADGAYDREPVYQAITALQPQAPPSIVIPPRRSAVLSAQADTDPSQRDGHIRLIQ